MCGDVGMQIDFYFPCGRLIAVNARRANIPFNVCDIACDSGGDGDQTRYSVRMRAYYANANALNIIYEICTKVYM